jgi:hypothetical protein
MIVDHGAKLYMAGMELQSNSGTSHLEGLVPYICRRVEERGAFLRFEALLAADILLSWTPSR